MPQYVESVDFPPTAAPTVGTPPAKPVAEPEAWKSGLSKPETAKADTEKAETSWLDAEVEVSVATYQAYQILYYAFIALPAIVGLDKFLHILGPWESYVSPALASFFHMSAGAITGFAGLIELAAAIVVALKPRIGSWVITGWLWLVALNLLTMRGHYDLFFITLALSAAGLAFTRLSAECN